MLKMIEQALASLSFPSQPQGLYEPVRYVLQGGGKRLRPTLLLMSYALYRDTLNEALPAAAGLEMYHNHTLLHDDLMDRADMRHGKPTVHQKWNDNTAVLSGDTMLIMAFRLVMQCGGKQGAEALQLFAKTAQEICEGQQYDVNFEQRTDVTEAEYLEMIRLKTSVLLACATAMGATLAQAPRSDVDALYRFGERIGLAFQLQDDYLDVYGDPAVFGKKIGGDILCGKKTYLLINALSRADEPTRAELLSLIADNTLAPADKISRVTDLYNHLGIPALTLAAIDRLYADAHQSLCTLSLPESRYAPLWQYAQSLLGRNK